MSITKIKTENLHKNFFQGKKSLHVLSGIEVEFHKATSYAIIGASGCGKSTLMHILGGLDTPTSGTVFYDKKNLFKFKSLEKEKTLNKDIGFVFQFHYLIKELSVIDNISLMGLIKGDSRKDCEKRAKFLLNEVGLIDKVNSYPTELSGGQLQRVAILRAIFNKPSFLLADEPTGDLDSQNALDVISLLEKCKDDWGMGIVMCSHDSNVYNKMDQVLLLDQGLLHKQK